jgi:hypothetical protein
MKRISLIVSVAALSLVTLAGIGSAHTQTVLDGDDSPGPLDLVAARHRHVVHDTGAGRERLLVFRFVTYEGWSNDALNGPSNYVYIAFRDRERCIEIYLTPEGALEGRMIHYGCRSIPGRPIGESIPVTRPDAHSARLALPKRLLGGDTSNYVWHIATSYEREGDPNCPPSEQYSDRREGSCTDFTRWKRHTS